MSRTTPLIALLAAVALLGAGCGKKPVSMTADGPEFIPRQDVNTPHDAWSEYQHAKAVKDVTTKDTKDAKDHPSVALSVPASWAGSKGIWRPTGGDKLNYIRAAYFPDIGPETEWSNEQKLPEYDVVHAEKTDKNYVLLMNHRGLKASVLKIITPDPASPGDGFYFVECHVAYDAKDRGALWDACKAAVDSATYQ